MLKLAFRGILQSAFNLVFTQHYRSHRNVQFNKYFKHNVHIQWTFKRVISEHATRRVKDIELGSCGSAKFSNCGPVSLPSHSRLKRVTTPAQMLPWEGHTNTHTSVPQEQNCTDKSFCTCICLKTCFLIGTI